jgi:hypothetical protein
MFRSPIGPFEGVISENARKSPRRLSISTTRRRKKSPANGGA